MLASITPLGERGRGNRWWLTAAAYELGSAAGGAGMGLALGALGLGLRQLVLAEASSRALLAAVAIVAALGLELASGRPGRALPTVRRQVDKAWLDRYRGWVYGVGFGLQLGAGIVTIVNSAAMYALAVVIVTIASPLAGLGLGAAYGLVRGLPLLVFARAGDFAGLQRAHRSLERLAASSRAGTLGVLAGGSFAIVAACVAVVAR